MDALKLGEGEQQYYAELFQAYDIEGSGKITGAKASDLFCASGLNPETLRQITELCGAKRLGHFGRSQFYIALKLVAVAQAGLPIKLDSLNSVQEVALPKFEQKGIVISDRKKSSGEPDGIGVESVGSSNKALNSQVSGQLPPPPKKSHIRSLSGHYRNEATTTPTSSSSNNAAISGSHFNSQVVNSTSEQAQNSKSPPPLSPTTSSTNPKQLMKQHTAPAGVYSNSSHSVSYSNQFGSADQVDGPKTIRSNSVVVEENSHVNPVALEEEEESVTQTTGEGPKSKGQEQPQHQHKHHNSVNSHGQENGNWAMFDDEESHMLIGSGVKQHYNNLEIPNFDSSSISSEAESVDDIWCINDEQREYYVNQFKTMQPDLNNVIKGSVAKHFFEKSKLPVTELSKIWQLSDLNCDGALSMEEFCIAMHLVVLRRNDIELPEKLPLSLMPYATLANDEPFAADLPPGSTLKRATPPSSPQNTAHWTAFVQESPDSSGVPSPANLANFEFAKPSADPDLKIVQPVAVRMSPDSMSKQSEGIDRGRAFSDSAMPYDYREGKDGEMTPPLLGKQRANTTAADSHGSLDTSQTETPNSKYNTPIHGRPRPVPPKKHSSVPALRGQLPPPIVGGEGNAESGTTTSSTEPSHAPPTPPPRPHPTRSMSVDVKQGSQLVAPAVPPRVSPKEAQSAGKGGDLPSGPAASHFEAPIQPPALNLSSENVPGSVEKDLMEDEDNVDGGVSENLQPSKTTVYLRQGSRDRREIQMAVRTHKERNAVLTRLNSELNQELQEVMEQRIALEIQLEHLRPFSS